MRKGWTGAVRGTKHRSEAKPETARPVGGRWCKEGGTTDAHGLKAVGMRPYFLFYANKNRLPYARKAADRDGLVTLNTQDVYHNYVCAFLSIAALWRDSSPVICSWVGS